MNLSKPARIVLLMLSILPAVYLVFFMASIGWMFATAAKHGGTVPYFSALIIVHLAVMLLTFALIAFYIVFLFRTTRVPNDMKALWAVVLLFGGIIAMPIFWYLYIWRDEERVVTAH